jgi:PadR family transcriptional regulator AphA
VYRSFGELATRGYIEEREPTSGKGPQRTVVRATRAGRAALRRWLDLPVDHIRDVRTGFLLKVALLERSGRPWGELASRQLAQLRPVFSALEGPTSELGFDALFAQWKRGQADAVERFLRELVGNRAKETRAKPRTR